MFLPLPDHLLDSAREVVSKSISFSQVGVTTIRTMPS
jgi:hypothetical protein